MATSRSHAQQFCRTAARQNYTSSKQISVNPAIKWKFKTNGQVYSSPVLFDDMITTGSCDSNLYTLNNSDGMLLWKFKAGGEVRSSVAIESNTVFL